MKTTIRTYLDVLAIACFLLPVLACSHPFAQHAKTKPIVETSASGEGFLSLSIDGLTSARTILPDSIAASDIAVYELVFRNADLDPVIVDRTNINIGNSISLAATNWNLTVTAYKDSGKTAPIAKATMENIPISAGNTVNKNITLQPIIEYNANGYFVWNIEFPRQASSTTMTITSLDTSAGNYGVTFSFRPWFQSYGGDILQNNADNPLMLRTGYYRVVFLLSNGKNTASREEYMHIYSNMVSRFEYTFTDEQLLVIRVTNGEDAGPGSLRQAILDAPNYGVISVNADVKVIYLESRLEINKGLTIEGNGVTLTRSPVWTTVDDNSQLVYSSGSIMAYITINRMHFKDGRANYGAAIAINGVFIKLNCCVFNGNQATSNGGVIYNKSGSLIVQGCTFYRNNVTNSGDIINLFNGYLTMTGNLFFGNSIQYSIVRGGYDTNFPRCTSNGYNVVDVPLGTDTGQSGWAPVADDTTFAALGISGTPFDTTTFAPVQALRSVIPNPPPADFPTTDFYGDTRTFPGAPGAVR